MRAEFSRGPHPEPVGLRLGGDVGFEQWRAIGRKLGTLNVAAAWATADWIVYGARFAKYGERYTDAVEATHLEEGTLRNYAMVARRFPIERRRPHLSIHHHAVVLALPPTDQDEWLQRAERERLSVNELRRRVRDERALGPAPPAAARMDTSDPVTDRTVPARLTCLDCGSSNVATLSYDSRTQENGDSVRRTALTWKPARQISSSVVADELDENLLLWTLREVADAAREVPLEAQPPRLRDALARLVVVPQPALADEGD
jgi:hypothetical protein